MSDGHPAANDDDDRAAAGIVAAATLQPAGGGASNPLPTMTDGGLSSPADPPAKAASSSNKNGPARRWSCETCRKRKIRCDGIRPTCGFCVRKKILPCVFVGTKDRADVDLARQFEAERLRRRLIKQILAAPAVPARTVKKNKSTPLISGPICDTAKPPMSASGGSDAQCGSPNSSFLGLASLIFNGDGLSDSLTSASLQSQTPPSFSPRTQTSGFSAYKTAASSSIPITPVSKLGTHSNAAEWDDPAFRRPGSAPGEQFALAVMFFKFPSIVVAFVHRRTILKNFRTISPLLRMAICAAGAHESWTSSTSEEVAQYYYDRACSMTGVIFENPSIEAFQSLLILVSIGTGIGQRSMWADKLRMAVSMVFALNLNLDPDTVPMGLLCNSSWVEKETRRRCWWVCYLIETTLAAIFFQPPLLTRNDSTVQPMCSDDLWFSSVDPIKLEHLYNQDRRPEKNLLTFRTQLADISNHIYTVSTPEPLKSMDWNAISAAERRLEQELANHWRSVPAEFKMELTEDWLLETIDRDFYLFDGVISHFLAFHGARSHLMRRRGLLYLQEVSASLVGSGIPPDKVNRVALQKGLSSAIAIAKLLALLMNTPGAVQRFPKHSISTGLRGCTILLMAEGLVPAFTVTDSPTESPIIGDIANADINPVDIPKHIDTYVAFLHAMSDRSKMANSLADMIEKMRSSDWNVVEALCTEPSKIHSVDVTVDGLDQDPTFTGVWPRRVKALSLMIRDCLLGIRTARDVSNRMSPLGAPSFTANGGTDGETRGHELPCRPLLASSSCGGAPLLSCPPFPVYESGTLLSPSLVFLRAAFQGGEGDGGGTNGDAAWLENEPPLADNPDDGDDAMVLLDWLFATDPNGG
ncbi:fungal-specific transcription factor domain-containing protein [Zopfochytrium polystomum]|nr:fungal-specific transcription factor domain-containing protein [Zopfochytrium polystomum]